MSADSHHLCDLTLFFKINFVILKKKSKVKKMVKAKKIFVLDTNVILHDQHSIFNFQDNDVVIPITVLEELDKFKKGNDIINFNARQFMRDLDKLAGKELFSEGISIGPENGRLFIETGKKFSEVMNESFSEPIADHRILSIAEFLHYKFHNRKVVLVSKDINLRMKAKAIGLQSEDYENDKVQDMEKIYEQVPEIELPDTALINAFYHSKKDLSPEELGIEDKIDNLQYFILKSGNSSALAYYSKNSRTIRRIETESAYGIKPRNAEQKFALDALLNPEIHVVALTGRAGTGKTLLALAAALEQRHLYQQIFLARPLVALSDKDMGYLPGSAKEKISPFMLPLFDNLSVIKNQFSAQSKDYTRIQEMLDDEKLLITPLAYIRGRSLSDVYFIVDEAQNLTPHEVKTIITRAGANAKMVFTGDIQQIDSPYLDTQSNGLTHLSDKMKGQHIFCHLNLMKGERSELAELASRLL
jgi:PhoH-like ATPase